MRLTTLLLILFAASTLSAGETTDQMLTKDVDAYGKTWIYDDLAKGFAEARASGKPLLISIRCVP